MAGTWDIVLCALLMSVCLPEYDTKESYRGYRVLRVTLSGDADWLAVESILSDQHLQLELWSAPSSPHDIVDIQVAAPMFTRLVVELDKHGIKHEIFMEDIQRMVEVEAKSDKYNLLRDTKLSHRERRSAPAHISNKVVGKYAPLSEIETWMKVLAQNWPEVVTLDTVGKTYEGRKIYALKLGKLMRGLVKPGIYLDGGIHAREWISPAAIIYIVYQLLCQYIIEGDEAVKYLDMVDWYFVPIANPDGYAYTHDTERLWRKNRRPNENSTCVGTDLNRNWPYHWGNVTPYTSDNPCSIVYLGPSPGSELETQSLMRYLLRHNDSIQAFISHHSYTQKWFTRWGYTNSTPPDHKQMLQVAERAVEALTKEGGEPYNVGRPFELLYAYTGGSADWAKGVAGIKYSYTVELRDRGRYGFLLPANYVVPVGNELFAAVKVVASQLISERYSGGEDIMPDTTTYVQTTPTSQDMTTVVDTSSTSQTTTHNTFMFPFDENFADGAAGLVILWDKVVLLVCACSMWTCFGPN